MGINSSGSRTVSAAWLRWAAALISVTAIVGISLIAAGAFDPKPLGSHRWSKSLSELSVEPHGRQLLWLDQTVPDQSFTLRLSAAHGSGERDSSYGLLIGDDQAFLAIALSPLGYVSVWQHRASQTAAGADESELIIMPWQLWPHVRLGAEENEIWLDLSQKEAGKMQAGIRINREILWQGEVWMVPSQVGIIGESFGEGAMFSFRSLQLFSE